MILVMDAVPSGLLAGKRLLVTGVVNTESIAFAVARAALLGGAQVALTTHDRVRELTERAAASLSDPVLILTLDVTVPEHFSQVAAQVQAEMGGLDGVLHAVAFGPRDTLSGDFLSASDEGIELAMRTSTTSFARLAALLADTAEGPAAIVGLDFDADGRAWPVYNWMGVVKLALQGVMRYTARDLGPRGIRSNLVAAGPLNTRAASGIGGFEKLLAAYASTAPLGWNPDDPSAVADTVCFLLSDLGRGITGEIIHVDGGYNAMAAAIR